MKEFAEIVFPIPLDRKFHYRIPPSLREKITVGMRVRVDFGHRSQTGYCVGFVSKPEVAKVKDIVRLEDEVPMLDEAMLELTRWIADYYLCSWGEALEAALPGGVRRQTSEKTTVSIGLNIPRDEVEDKIKELEKKSSQQTRILRLLAESDKPFMPVQEMLAMAKLRTASPINSLKRRKLIRTVRQVVEYDPFMTAPVKKTQPFTPTPEQARAIKAIKQSIEQGQPVTWLLLGVTNSGKTEVYLQVIQSLVKQGKQSIILVPEISLTPQTVQRFRERFDRVAVLHSYLTPGQRAAQWHKIRSGEVQVVIGARSAVFAPFKNLGLVVLEEEHEPSFKQENRPMYHAREVAIKRAEIAQAVVVLGTATPSLESYYRAQKGEFQLLRLPERIERRPLPPVEIINLTHELSPTKRQRPKEVFDHQGRSHAPSGKTPFPFISRRMELMVRDTLEQGNQVILFINRRGFVTLISCPKCGFVLRCTECQVALTYHKKVNKTICHHCNEESEPPTICPECGHRKLRYSGVGTERIEERIKTLFGNYQIVRMDSDAISTSQARREALNALWTGEADILVGTQMIAKGLDFPNVTLVGIISGDTGLYQKDFRSAERTFQLITQVAGRAGRGPKGGRVLIQTINPEHYSIVCASRHDYEAFAEQELQFRQALLYPPFSHLFRILAEGKNQDKVAEYIGGIGEGIEKFLQEKEGGEMLGPSPAPLARIKGFYRWHIVIKAKDPQIIRQIRARYEKEFTLSTKQMRISLDVDPISLL